MSVDRRLPLDDFAELIKAADDHGRSLICPGWRKQPHCCSQMQVPLWHSVRCWR